MSRCRFVALAAVASLSALAAPARSQEPPRPEAAAKTEAPRATVADKAPEQPAKMPDATVRVQLVISRYQGETKVASLPYTLVVATGGARTRMRMGVETPVPVMSFAPSESGGSKPSTSYQYKNVGTNIDCAVWERNRQYKLSLSVENSSAFSGPDAHAAGTRAEGAPLFRTFNTSIEVVLRDGETIQTMASTDPVTGEVVKIDVTLNVVK